jgi:hypothetical protein
LYVGLGCGGCALLLGVFVVVSVIGGIRLARNIEREMEDPVAREEKAEELLGTEELPEGYYAVVSISLPLVLETVILSDRPGGEDHGISADATKLFVYIEAIRGDRRWRDYLEGKADASEVLAQQGIRMERPAEEVGRGEILLDGATVDYVSQRGTLMLQDDNFDGLSTFLLIRCEGSKKMRIAVWSAAETDPATPADELDLSGTCADPDEMEAFLAPFDLCGN